MPVRRQDPAPQPRHAGGVSYTLERKQVKNINLRVRPDGSVWVSASRRTPLSAIDGFVAGKADWVAKHQARLASRTQARDAAPLPDRQAALALFTQVSGQYFPLFREVLGGEPPELKIRSMTSRWGVCHPAKRRITLALQLAAKPLPLVEYVVLHEYCHFVHPDHGAGFWALLESHMPDARARRAALRRG